MNPTILKVLLQVEVVADGKKQWVLKRDDSGAIMPGQIVTRSVPAPAEMVQVGATMEMIFTFIPEQQNENQPC